MKELGVAGFLLGLGSFALVFMIILFPGNREKDLQEQLETHTHVEYADHTHELTGIQIGSTICIEPGTLHYPDPIDGSDAHIDAAFCGVVGEVEEERFPPLGTDTHLAQ